MLQVFYPHASSQELVFNACTQNTLLPARLLLVFVCLYEYDALKLIQNDYNYDE